MRRDVPERTGPEPGVVVGHSACGEADHRKADRRVILSTVSSDAHTWNLVFLHLFLEENGYQVINLGPCVPDELLVSSAAQEQPYAIVISSVNGHGYRDGAQVVRALRRDPRTRAIPVVIGGKLDIRGSDDRSCAAGLLAAGCDVVITDANTVALRGMLLQLEGFSAGRARMS